MIVALVQVFRMARAVVTRDPNSWCGLRARWRRMAGRLCGGHQLRAVRTVVYPVCDDHLPGMTCVGLIMYFDVELI